ncbi:MAG: cysteine desulfurase family protein [Gemmataceae bacterium]
MSNSPIYLDNHASTRCDPRVVQAMLPYFDQEYANPSSLHAMGRRAAQAVDAAREQVADLLGADPCDIVFTSGATESISLALLGVLSRHRSRGDHLIVAATEHKAVLETAYQWQAEGGKVSILPVDRFGCVDLDDLDRAINDHTVLVSLMAANNEVGTLLPLDEVGRICRARGVLFHSDATQWVGKRSLDVGSIPVDLLSFSGHKMYGPKGIGVLYLRRPEVRLTPRQVGGGQERGLRAGTLAVPLIVGLGVACQLAQREMLAEAERLALLRDRLWQFLRDELDGVYLNGHPTQRLPGNLNVSFDWINGAALLLALREEVAVSTGAACTEAGGGASYVLQAMGLDKSRAEASLRFGLGRFTTAEEIDRAAIAVVQAVRQLRANSPLYWMRHEHEVRT